MNSPKIPEGLQTFLSHAESLHPSNNAKRENGFAREFQQLKALSSQLKKNPEYSCHHGEMECNRPKNRYKDIVPFDYNRIILPTLPGVLGSDYINGNYVKGADGNVAYLAAQGPLPRTVDDFWRLIASHKCQIVIMVCKEIEMGKLKCKRYWPESKDEKLNFAGLEISLISEDDIAEGFIMRTMLMKSGQEEMMVTQLQYTAWPDHDVPKSAEPLIEMNKTLRALQGNRKQQVLIHCSAGCGRTGTICAVDFAWSLLKMQKTNNFSVYDIVANLRRQRMAMVQTKEQYQLVYKAVVQLVNEELEQEKFKFHTYVNVNVPGSPKSPPGHSNYENCEFIRSVGRWKQSDLQNGSVPRAPLSLPLEGPKETKTDRRSSSGNKAAIPPPSPEEMTAKSGAEKNKDYVNVEFVNKNDLGSKLATASSENKPAISTKPTLPPRDLNKPILDSNAVNGAVPSHSAGQQKSPTAADYEVLPKAASSPAFISSGKVIAVPNNKGSVSDYEILPPPAHGDKKQARHVPDGLLIDLGDDVPPLPDKRHSLGSSRYESVEVKPLSPPGVSSQRSSSSSNVLDDMFLLGGGGLQHQATGPQNTKKVADSKGFHTVPNRLKPTPGPKRCPVTQDLFEDPRASVGGGFKGMNSPTEASGEYSLVGAISPPSPPKVSLTPVAQSNPGAGLQMTTPREKGQHPSPPRKQADKPSKARSPVGAYSLVGIPETGSQMPVVVGTVAGKQNTAAPVEVKAKPVVPVDIKGKPGVPVDVKSKPGVPVEVKGKPTAEPSYELVGQWQQPVRKVSPPTPSTDNPKSAGIRNAEANKGVKGELQGSPHFRPKVIKEKGGDKSDVIPGIFLRGQGDGEVASGVTVVGTDVYAAVGPRELRGSSSPNINSRSSPKLRNQTSSSSLSCASASSDDLEEDAPPIPVKTNESFRVPGEEPHESVQHSSKGTMERGFAGFKKMIKTGKGSLPKFISDVSLPHVSLPRSNSSGSGVTTRSDADLGYKKRVTSPKGPRSCPKHWPSFAQFGL